MALKDGVLVSVSQDRRVGSNTTRKLQIHDVIFHRQRFGTSGDACSSSL
jgi:hypothetical protein